MAAVCRRRDRADTCSWNRRRCGDGDQKCAGREDEGQSLHSRLLCPVDRLCDRRGRRLPGGKAAQTTLGKARQSALSASSRCSLRVLRSRRGVRHPRSARGLEGRPRDRAGRPRSSGRCSRYCSCPRRDVPTERLVDELWGEQPPATAVKAVQVYVSQLRKTLGEGVIETRPAGYVLRLEHGALDLQRFEGLLADGRRAARRRCGRARPARSCARRSGSGAASRSPTSATRRSPANEIGRLDGLRLVALEQRLEADLATRPPRRGRARARGARARAPAARGASADC